MFQAAEKLIPCDDVPQNLVAEADALVREALCRSPAVDGPVLIHLGGIPGAGKSTYAQKLLAALEAAGQSFVLVSNDAVMESLKGYRTDRDADPIAAFVTWQMAARAIGYHLFHSMIANRRNVLFDHGANFPEHVDLLRRCKEEKGYVTYMHFLSCDLDVARERVRRREVLTQRHTPGHLLADRAKILQGLMPAYQQIVDGFLVINASGKAPAAFANPYLQGLHKA